MMLRTAALGCLLGLTLLIRDLPASAQAPTPFPDFAINPEPYTVTEASAEDAASVSERVPIVLAPTGAAQVAELQQLKQFLADPRTTPVRISLVNGLANDFDWLSSYVVNNPRALIGDRYGFSEGLSNNLALLAKEAGYPAAAALYHVEADYYHRQRIALGCPCYPPSQ